MIFIPSAMNGYNISGDDCYVCYEYFSEFRGLVDGKPSELDDAAFVFTHRPRISAFMLMREMHFSTSSERIIARFNCVRFVRDVFASHNVEP